MAKSARLGRGATKKIGNAIDDLFNNAKARLLGPQSIQGKKIHIGFIREMSLPGIFEAGSLEEMVKPDLDILDSLIRVAGSYIDAHRERTKARVVHEINGAMAEAKHNGGMSQSDFRGVVNTKLSEVWADVTRNIHSIVDTELSHAKNVSVLDGVIGSNAAAGIDDPVVYFVVVRDNILCKECKRLHLMDDEKTPRLWYLSELGHGYHKKGEEQPKIGGLHPHCRCTLVTLLPSYGFTTDGMVKYVKRGHLELPVQRGLARSEEILYGDIFDMLAKNEVPTISQSEFSKEIEDLGWMPDGDNTHKDRHVHLGGPSWTGFQHGEPDILEPPKQEKYLKQLGLTRFFHRKKWYFAINPRLDKMATAAGIDGLNAKHQLEAYRKGGYLDTHTMDAVRAKADAERATSGSSMPEDAEIEKAKARALSAQAAIARRTAGA